MHARVIPHSGRPSSATKRVSILAAVTFSFFGRANGPLAQLQSPPASSRRDRAPTSGSGYHEVGVREEAAPSLQVRALVSCKPLLGRSSAFVPAEPRAAVALYGSFAPFRSSRS